MYQFIKISLMFLLGALVLPAAAQVAPDASEIAGYRGLFFAAAKGDTVLAEKLIASGANVNARSN